MKLFNKIVLKINVLLSLIIIGCTVGLGESIDTSVPVVNISYPPNNVVIRSIFNVAGSCSDDREVMGVNVKLTNTTLDITYEENIAIVNSDKESWQLTVDSSKYLDGEYVVTATVYDEGGHKSSATLSIKIDNTAPMLFFIAPSTYSDSQSPLYQYGDYFDLEGYSSELNSIKSVDINITGTDNSGSASLSTPINTNNWYTYCPVARWNSPSGSVFKDVYTALYGSTKDLNDPEKKYKLSLTVTDNARLYYDISDYDGIEAGNITTCFWLWDEVVKALNNYNYGLGDNISPKELMEIYNDTMISNYTNIKADIKQILNDLEHDSVNKPLVFSLLPSN